MATKKKITLTEELVETPLDYKTVFFDSVIDGKLTKVEGYISDTRINESSKLISYQEDDKQPVNVYFTKK